ncbi:uncharacterized protein [Drosophila suzukii]|uniref:Reverse transcriptase n=1 Tax=Drosophila suzukii TaxID=28584 RepID=A0ABM4TNH0_DROSZ
MQDTRLSYREHLEYVNKKASETTGSLCRILLNIRGSKQVRRQVPLCELVQEAKEIRAALAGDQANHRAKTRMQSVDNWQAAWDNSSKGRWTHQLIPSIEPWVKGKHAQVDFYLTQALSGHGCFRSFLKRFGNNTEHGCPECGSGIVEDAQHILFECRRFGYDRQILHLMLPNEANWEATTAYAASVLRTLRRTDNERRGATA